MVLIGRWLQIPHHQIGKIVQDIVFTAHPRLNGMPRKVPDTIANRHVLLALKKQPFPQFIKEEGALTPYLEKLKAAARSSDWLSTALQQTPATLWAHG